MIETERTSHIRTALSGPRHRVRGAAGTEDGAAHLVLEFGPHPGAPRGQREVAVLMSHSPLRGGPPQPVGLSGHCRGRVRTGHVLVPHAACAPPSRLPDVASALDFPGPPRAAGGFEA